MASSAGRAGRAVPGAACLDSKASPIVEGLAASEVVLGRNGPGEPGQARCPQYPARPAFEAILNRWVGPEVSHKSARPALEAVFRARPAFETTPPSPNGA
ncbi:hypothetical protein JCM18897A_39950 [Streptomyces sp. JCM 18897]